MPIRNSLNNATNTLTISSLGAGVAQTSSSGAVSSSNGTNGQVLIGGGSAPAWASISAGANITLTPGANTLTIAASGGGSSFTWNVITDPTTTVSMVANNGYIYNGSLGLNLTLPATAAAGTILRVTSGQPASAIWLQILQNAGQTIAFTDFTGTNSTTTTGVSGRLENGSGSYGSVELICTTANTDWTIISYTSPISTV
jgi:hypothetical protein